MLAKNDAYKEPRIYALDRILDLKQTKTSFKLPKGFEPKDVFRKLFGVILDNGPVEEIIIRVSDDQVKYYRTLPLHHSQEEGECGDGYTEFRYRLVPTFDFCGGLENHQLQTVAAACGYDLTNHHHALADAEACAWIARVIL